MPPRLMGDQREGGFRYTHRGRVYPSVTTILGAAEPKPWMRAWATRETALWAVESLPTWRDLEPDDAVALIKRGPERHRTRAANLGTAVHLYAETGGEGQVPKELVPYCRSFARFVEDHKPEPIATEERVFNTRIGYAGTFDSWFRIPGDTIEGVPAGSVVLADYKSGKGIYSSVALQLRAYAEGEFIQGEDGSEQPMPPRPDHFYGVHLRPRGYALVKVDAWNPEVWRAFRAMCAVRHWIENVEPFVLGRA